MPDLNEQAQVVNDFLVGLLDAFGLEGDVETSVEVERDVWWVGWGRVETLAAEVGDAAQNLFDKAQDLLR